jgi:hypothetical protein
MGFGQWLRHNSEHYLLEAAQQEMARRYLPPERQPRAPGGAFFWRRLFVPLYRRVPWGVRAAIIGLMPGSHRRTWTTWTRRTP